jgi:hypothetical protein
MIAGGFVIPEKHNSNFGVVGIYAPLDYYDLEFRFLSYHIHISGSLALPVRSFTQLLTYMYTTQEFNKEYC